MGLFQDAFFYFRTQLFEWKEERAIRLNFIHNPHFLSLDQLLQKAYADQNPYQICKEYLKQKKKKEIYAYGETPLTTMDKIVRECQITPQDQVIDMGAGRGRASLFLAEYIGCKVRALEEIPLFVQIMEQTIASPHLEMSVKDMFQADFSWASVIYLYGTLLSDEEILLLAETFPRKKKIITVSYALEEYSPEYQTKKVFQGKFPWGKTEIFWNERI